MRRPWLLAGCLTLLSTNANALEPTFEAGVGLPELVHIRVGAFTSPRVAVHLHASNVVFNWLVGISATSYLLGDAEDAPPPHAMLLRGTFGVNPVASPIRIRSGGETIGAAAIVEGGYGLASRGGFLFHATVGAVLLVEDGLTAGPTLSLGAGWRFQ